MFRSFTKRLTDKEKEGANNALNKALGDTNSDTPIDKVVTEAAITTAFSKSDYQDVDLGGAAEAAWSEAERKLVVRVSNAVFTIEVDLENPVTTNRTLALLLAADLIGKHF